MKDGEFCPLIKKKCCQHKCAWYTQVRGLNPQTGQEVDEWKCAVTWMPMMSVEIAQKTRGTTAAVESFRNETVAANERNNQLYTHALNQGIVQAQITPHPPINTLPANQ
jgi:hypothetical protein